MIAAKKVFFIKDNGLRCLMPPCPSWDVIDIESGTVEKASDVDLSQLHLDNDSLDVVQNRLFSDEVKVRGYFTNRNYIPSNVQGRVFIIEEIVG